MYPRTNIDFVQNMVYHESGTGKSGSTLQYERVKIMSSRTVITIARQYGSGGREIGEMLAKKLNVPYYDKELIALAAKKSGLSEEVFRQADERATSSLLYSLVMGTYGYGGGVAGMNDMPINDKLFLIQADIIRKAAEEGACVIVGRCADYILKDNPDAFHIFVHAAPAFRADRIVRLYGESEKKPEERLDDKDTRRKVNYKHFTGREWGRCQNYHLSLDSGIIGIQRCVDIISELAKTL